MTRISADRWGSYGAVNDRSPRSLIPRGFLYMASFIQTAFRLSFLFCSRSHGEKVRRNDLEAAGESSCASMPGMTSAAFGTDRLQRKTTLMPRIQSYIQMSINQLTNLSTDRRSHHEYLTSRTSKCSASIVLHLSFRSKSPNIAFIQQISPELVVLATEVRVSIGNQVPRNQSTCHRKRRPNQECPLQRFTFGREGFLDGDENLCTDGCPRLPYRGRKAEEMTTKRCWKRLGAAEESGDLREDVSNRRKR
jgi:hypothetical protein